MGKTVGVVLSIKDRFSLPLKDLAAKLNTNEKALKKANLEIKKFQTQVSKGFSNMSKGIGLAGVATISALGAIGVKAVQTAGQFEQYNVAFETMLGSQQKASKLMGEITKYAAATPFEMPTLVEGTKRLVAFGVGANVVVDRLGRLGDLSMGDAEKLDRLTLAYGKIKAKGKASLEELNQLTEAGVPIMAELAKQQHVSTGTLFKYVQKGKIGYKEVEKAVISLTSKGGQFYNMTLKQSKTLNGLFSTVTDSFNIMGAQIAQQFLPQIKDIAIRLINSAPKIQAVLTTAFNAALPVVNALISTIGFLIDNFNTIIPVASGVLATFLTFKTISGVITVFNSLKSVITAINVAQGVWNALLLANPIGLIAVGIGAVIGVTVLLVLNWKKVVNVFKQAWEWIVKVTKGLFGIKDKNINVNVNKNEISNGGTPKPNKKPPAHALGTNYFQGGDTRVNEGGKGELINLPSGAQIIPHDLSKKAVGGSKPININIKIDTFIGAKEFLKQVKSEIAGELTHALAKA